MNRETHHQIVEGSISAALDYLFPLGEGEASRPRVEHILNRIAEQAFEEGRVYALTSLLTVEEMADILGVSTRRVRARAQLLHGRFGVGRQVSRGTWLFTPEEIDLLRPGKPGRSR